jgi:hypothetical protein
LDADALEVLNHARTDLDETLAEVLNSAFASLSVSGMASRTASMSQYAAV